MNKISDGTLVSTRIRLARNIEGMPFPGHLKDEKQAKEIIRLVSSGLNRLDDFKLYYMDSISEWDAESLVGNHLISPNLIAKKRMSAALINEDSSLSVMINEEDHLREQCIVKGLQLRRAYDKISEIDSKIGKKIKFSYDEQLGYLTACPTNLGTGLRASVMLYLPAMTINGLMREVIRLLSKQGLTVRGVYGEGSEAEGYMYQISNEVTLGVTEEDIIDQVDKTARKITELECTERRNLINGVNSLAVKDKCKRAYGVVTNCARLTSGELVSLAADIKLGACLGYINIDDVYYIDDIVTKMQPYNINKAAGKNLSAEERDIYRADYAGSHIKALCDRENSN
ncbi:MAG: ATP--guanido phosphotransferase [Clostridia bacterium]|nr:ATP--guanido phosphotransferase [Clostridia bacterium]